jgi:hypothetical protein
MDGHALENARRGRAVAPRAHHTLAAAVVLAVSLLAGGMVHLASPQPAVALDLPPTFEYVLTGDGEAGDWTAEDSATALAVGGDGSLYACSYLWHDTTGYDLSVACLDDAFRHGHRSRA